MTKETVYVVHPVSPAMKAEIVGQGYKIVDAKFAPKDAKIIGQSDEETVVDSEPVEIPEDWETMQWRKKLQLAEKIVGASIVAIDGKTLAEMADNVVSAEVSKRAEAA
ncbi:MAG: hypothetical protein COB78_10885 [Hyphomicrobiales bacterium]|nr:MAG: hypothetical protein COB78_10885 [Hyphomicrobiales bacterium]